MLKQPNVHNNWDPLEEVWLGDVWPRHFYDNLSPEVRDAWYQITDWTREDLAQIQRTLEGLGVRVLRPRVDGNPEEYMALNPNKELVLKKPPICPRDTNLVVGNKLYFKDHDLLAAYGPLLNQYEGVVPVHNGRTSWAHGANTVKIGRDIVIDKLLWDPSKQDWPLRRIKQWVFRSYQEFLMNEARHMSDYRITLCTQGGHCDARFMPLRLGLLMVTEYYKEYDNLYKGWEKIILNHPNFYGPEYKTINNGRWWVPGFNPGNFFNQHIEQYCSEWIGTFTETYFDVNVLVIDEKNIVCIGEHHALFEELDRRGITCHPVPFRTRTFWDGGVHCLTLDTIRQGTLQDYYPEQGDPCVKEVLSKYFNYNSEQFYNEYALWCKTGQICL